MLGLQYRTMPLRRTGDPDQVERWLIDFRGFLFVFSFTRYASLHTIYTVRAWNETTKAPWSTYLHTVIVYT